MSPVKYHTVSLNGNTLSSTSSVVIQISSRNKHSQRQRMLNLDTKQMTPINQVRVSGALPAWFSLTAAPPSGPCPAWIIPQPPLRDWKPTPPRPPYLRPAWRTSRWTLLFHPWSRSIASRRNLPTPPPPTRTSPSSRRRRRRSRGWPAKTSPMAARAWPRQINSYSISISAPFLVQRVSTVPQRRCVSLVLPRSWAWIGPQTKTILLLIIVLTTPHLEELLCIFVETLPQIRCPFSAMPMQVVKSLSLPLLSIKAVKSLWLKVWLMGLKPGLTYPRSWKGSP